MSVKKLTYRCWRLLEGGDIPDDSRFRYSEIRDHVRAAIFSALKQNYFETRNDEGGFKYGNDSATITTVVTTQEDDVTGLTYIDVENASISIPATNRLLSISDLNPYSRASRTFASVRSEEVFVGQLQPPIPCTVLYERTGGRIYFYNELVTVGQKLRLAQKYAVPDNDDDELNLPPEYELQVVDSVTRLLDRELRIRDTSNDGVPEPINRI